MMRRALHWLILSLILIVGFGTSTLVWSDVQVEYRINRLQGLVDFALALSGEPHQSPGILEAFKRSKYNTPEIQKELETLTPIHSSLLNGYQFAGNPPSRRDGAQVLKLIQTQSLFARNLQDLSTRSLGLLPLAQHRDYFSLLEKLEPIYDAIIWKSSAPALRQHQAVLTKFAKKADLNRMFAATEKLYHGAWPKGVPFSIGLYPVPYLNGFKNYTISQSIGSIEEHGVLIGSQNLDASESFGVIFHELCHSVYNTQPVEFMQAMDRWFASSSSPSRLQAQNWFNEALATAIGNGWANARINGGRLSQQSWYSEMTIDRFAKAIYPMVNQALQSGSTINELFIHKVVDIFSKTFPEALRTYANLMNNIVFLHNGNLVSENEAYTEFNRYFLISSLSSENSVNSKAASQAASNPLATLVLQFSTADLKKIDDWTAPYPHLQKQSEIIGHLANRSIFTTTDENFRVYIVIIANTIKDFSDGVEEMEKVKTFNDKTPSHTF